MLRTKQPKPTNNEVLRIREILFMKYLNSVSNVLQSRIDSEQYLELIAKSLGLNPIPLILASRLLARPSARPSLLEMSVAASYTTYELGVNKNTRAAKMKKYKFDRLTNQIHPVLDLEDSMKVSDFIIMLTKVNKETAYFLGGIIYGI